MRSCQFETSMRGLQVPLAAGALPTSLACSNSCFAQYLINEVDSRSCRPTGSSQAGGTDSCTTLADRSPFRRLPVAGAHPPRVSWGHRHIPKIIWEQCFRCPCRRPGKAAPSGTVERVVRRVHCRCCAREQGPRQQPMLVESCMLPVFRGAVADGLQTANIPYMHIRRSRAIYVSGAELRSSRRERAVP